MPIVLTSGGFDPLHPGHLECLKRSKALVPDARLVVALNSDEWLLRKKGYLMMDFNSRAAILRGLECVDHVIGFDDSDGTACDAIRHVKPDYFTKGGDRTAATTPEAELCAQLGVEVRYGLGDKIASSSTIFTGALPAVERPWGTYRIIYNQDGIQVKILDIRPSQATSNQRHAKRNEIFVDLNTLAGADARFLPVHAAAKGEWHQLFGGDAGRRYLEIQYGEDVDESDIERQQ